MMHFSVGLGGGFVCCVNEDGASLPHACELLLASGDSAVVDVEPATPTNKKGDQPSAPERIEFRLVHPAGLASPLRETTVGLWKPSTSVRRTGFRQWIGPASSRSWTPVRDPPRTL